MKEKINHITELFSLVGYHLLSLGMNSSHSGNLSGRDGSHIYITRTGTMLGDIREEDLIKAEIMDSMPSRVSMEYPVHRQIYLDSSFNAVIHCHPPYAIALSMGSETIEPIDMEGVRIVGNVPVISGENDIPQRVSAQLQNGHGGVMIEGHGVFAAANNLEEALHYVTALEMSAKIITLSR